MWVFSSATRMESLESASHHATFQGVVSLNHTLLCVWRAIAPTPQPALKNHHGPKESDVQITMFKILVEELRTSWNFVLETQN